MLRKSYIKIVLCFFISLFSLSVVVAQGNDGIENIPDMEFKLNNNKTVKLRELKGKVVLLDFWYRGCGPCLMAVPGLIELQEEFKDDLIIIGINGNDIQEDVTDYLNYKKANYFSTYKNGEKISKLFNVQLYPTTILYDRDGKLIKKESGYRKRGINALRKAIKKALK